MGEAGQASPKAALAPLPTSPSHFTTPGRLVAITCQDESVSAKEASGEETQERLNTQSTRDVIQEKRQGGRKTKALPVKIAFLVGLCKNELTSPLDGKSPFLMDWVAHLCSR